MKINVLVRSVSAGALFAFGLVSTQAAIVTDGSFEVPTTGGRYPYGNSLVYGPIHPNWSFSSSGAGLQRTGDGGTVFNEPTPGTLPDGSTHFVFLQMVGATISQLVDLPAEGTYRLTYWIAGRNSGDPSGGSLTYKVFLDAGLIAEDSTVDHQAWTLKSYEFAATAGTHTLKFEGVGTPPGRLADQSALLDAVGISAVPESSTWVAGLATLLGAAGVVIRRKT